MKCCGSPAFCLLNPIAWSFNRASGSGRSSGVFVPKRSGVATWCPTHGLRRRPLSPAVNGSLSITMMGDSRIFDGVCRRGVTKISRNHFSPRFPANGRLSLIAESSTASYASLNSLLIALGPAGAVAMPPFGLRSMVSLRFPFMGLSFRLLHPTMPLRSRPLLLSGTWLV